MMNQQQKEETEYTTGRNLLFLSYLLSSKGSFENARDYLIKLLIEKVQKPMTLFSNNISKSKWDMYVFSLLYSYIKLMSAFLTNHRPPTGYGVDEYDHRFFYIEENRCYCASGIVWPIISMKRAIWEYFQIQVGLDVLRNSKEILQ